MRQRYPDALDIPSAYCEIACIAEDRATAKRLFEEFGDRLLSRLWRDPARFARDRRWALGEK